MFDEDIAKTLAKNIEQTKTECINKHLAASSDAIIQLQQLLLPVKFRPRQ